MTARSKRSLQRVQTVSLVTLATIGVGSILYWGRPAFVPIMLALLLTLLLWPAVDALHRRRVPRFAGAALVLLSVVGGVAVTVQAVWSPARVWLDSAPQTLAMVERKIKPVARVLAKLEGVTDRATRLGSAGPSQRTAVALAVPSSDGMIRVSREIAFATMTVFVLSFFLLSGGSTALAHTATAIADRAGARRLLEVANCVRVDVSRYVSTVALINLGLGVVTALMTAAWGMPSPILWGTMAAVLNFAPYVGSAITLCALTVAGLVVFGDLGTALAVGGCYLLLTAIEGQIVQPLLVGKRLDLSPTAVFLAMWFGGWFWGFAGILIAVPILVAVKASATRIPSWATVATLLSPARDRTEVLATSASVAPQVDARATAALQPAVR